jgi:hypothetical protein
VLLIFYFFQDLELHQSFLKRVKVLVATFAELAAQLLDQEQLKEEQEGKIEGDGILIEAADFPPISPPQATTETPSVVSSTTPLFASSKTPSAGSSKTPLSAGWISFRSKRHLERTAALAESLRKDFKYCVGNKKLNKNWFYKENLYVTDLSVTPVLRNLSGLQDKHVQADGRLGTFYAGADAAPATQPASQPAAAATSLPAAHPLILTHRRGRRGY